MNKSRFFLALISLTLIGQGCLRLKPNDGGVFRSVTKGELWEQKSQILSTGGRIRDFSNVDVLTLIIDPSDHRALYAGTNGQGIFYTYDGGESWQQFPQFSAGAVKAMAVDAVNKTIIYASVGNRIFKTFDGGRNWQQVFVDTRENALITTIAADPSSSGLLFAGNRAGDILRTNDGGFSWTVVKRLDNPIVKILVHPSNRFIVYAATEDRGIFKSSDNGAVWIDLNSGLKQFSGALSVKDLIFIDKGGEGLMFSSRYGLIRSYNGGLNWQPLSLLTPPGTATIRALAVNQNNNKEIYYATNSTFYRSFDAGVKWSNKQLPSSRQPSALLIDQVNPNVLYLGLIQIVENKQQSFFYFAPYETNR